MGYRTPSPKKVRELLSPEKVPFDAAPPSSSAVPVATLAARSSDAKGRLIEAELRQKFGEEVRWHKKQADHLAVELETARAKRKEMEADFAKTKADLEHQLKEALAENEDLLAAGGGQRGPRAELEASRKEVESLRKELGILQARLADGIEARRVHVGELRDTRDRLCAAQAEVQALKEAMTRGQAQEAKSAELLAKAVARAEQAESDARGAAEMAARVTALEAQAKKLAAEAAQASSRAEHAESAAAASNAELHATKQTLQARIACMEEEASQARALLHKARAQAADADGKRAALLQESEAMRKQVEELHAQQVAAKEQRALKMQQAEQMEAEVKTVQAQLCKQRARADGLAARLAVVEGSAEGVKAAASASQALSKCQRELMELQAEYNRAVYDMAKARAEHSEMAGKVTKAKAEAASMAQRLAAAHLALAEVVHVVRLSSDDVACEVQNDQDSVPDVRKGDSNVKSVSKSPSKGSSTLACLQLARVRKIIEQADEQRRVSEGDVQV